MEFIDPMAVKEKNKGDNLQVLQLQKQDNGKLNDPSSFGIADLYRYFGLYRYGTLPPCY